AAVFREIASDVACGSIAIVGGALDHDRHAARPVSFICELFDVVGAGAAGTFFNGALNIVVGHALRFGSVDRLAQAKVGVDVAASQLGRHDDLARHLGVDHALLGINHSLLPLDIGPFRMTGHEVHSYIY